MGAIAESPRSTLKQAAIKYLRHKKAAAGLEHKEKLGNVLRRLQPDAFTCMEQAGGWECILQEPPLMLVGTSCVALDWVKLGQAEEQQAGGPASQVAGQDQRQQERQQEEAAGTGAGVGAGAQAGSASAAAWPLYTQIQAHQPRPAWPPGF